jgi:hypothetical protein
MCVCLNATRACVRVKKVCAQKIAQTSPIRRLPPRAPSQDKSAPIRMPPEGGLYQSSRAQSWAALTRGREGGGLMVRVAGMGRKGVCVRFARRTRPKKAKKGASRLGVCGFACMCFRGGGLR